MKHDLKPTILGTALAALTYAALVWDRHFHPTVSSPTPSEERLAAVLWLIVLGLYFVGFPLLVIASRLFRARPGWPIRELLIAAGGILVVVLFFDFLPRWPEVFNSDLELAFFLYLAGSLVYVLALGRLLSNWSSGTWAQRGACLATSAMGGFLVVATSWVVLYFE